MSRKEYNDNSSVILQNVVPRKNTSEHWREGSMDNQKNASNSDQHPPSKTDVVIDLKDENSKLKDGRNPAVFDNSAFIIDDDMHKADPHQQSGPGAAPTPVNPEEEGSSKDWISSISAAFSTMVKTHWTIILWIIRVLALVTFLIYLGFAIHLTWDKAKTWCNGTKFFIILVAIAFLVFINKILGRRLAKCLRPCIKTIKKGMKLRFSPCIVWGLIYLSLVIFIIVDSSDNRYRLVSLAGLGVLLLLGYLFSTNRSKVVWRHVLWGSALQFSFGLLIIRWSFGRLVFQCLGDKVSDFLAFTDSGSGFVFGYLVTGMLYKNTTVNVTLANETTVLTLANKTVLTTQIPPYLLKVDPVFCFKVLSVVVFFSFFISILYYYGIMQVLVVKVGWLLQNTMGTTACESMNAAGNIFLGMTEAPLIIKPFLPIMTKSEIHAVMTGGFATIAGSVMAAYINFGVSASHLLSASVMSAPAALAFSKLICPETEVSRTSAEDIKTDKGKESNALEAAAQGASTAITLVANIAANLIAFLAFIAFLNHLLGWFGGLVGWSFLSFEWILSKLFIPLSLIMGVELKDLGYVAELVGLKTVVNEFVGYSRLAEMKKQQLISKRSEAIATYALCGFSNIGSIGIQLGSLGAMAPERKSDLARLAVRAMIAGSAACFMTACIAGALLQEASL